MERAWALLSAHPICRVSTSVDDSDANINGVDFFTATSTDVNFVAQSFLILFTQVWAYRR